MKKALAIGTYDRLTGADSFCADLHHLFDNGGVAKDEAESYRIECFEHTFILYAINPGHIEEYDVQTMTWLDMSMYIDEDGKLISLEDLFTALKGIGQRMRERRLHDIS